MDYKELIERLKNYSVKGKVLFNLQTVKEAAATIEQLVSKTEELEKQLDWWKKQLFKACYKKGELSRKVGELEKQLAEVNAERDAAIKELKKAADDNGRCYGCKWLDEATDKCTNKLGKIECDSVKNNMWEWRGKGEQHGSQGI